jgi:hypothetical protein
METKTPITPDRMSSIGFKDTRNNSMYFSITKDLHVVVSFTPPKSVCIAKFTDIDEDFWWKDSEESAEVYLEREFNYIEDFKELLTGLTGKTNFYKK